MSHQMFYVTEEKYFSPHDSIDALDLEMVSSSPGSPQIPSLKRARSDTGASGTMSPKRANSEVVDDVGQDLADTRIDRNGAVLDAAIDDEFDAYMKTQDAGETDIGTVAMATLDHGPSPEGPSLDGPDQHTFVSNMCKIPLDLGTTWYVVATDWMIKWRAATGAVPSKDHANISLSNVGPIDNSSIIHPGTKEMLPDLELDKDYEIMPDSAWAKLVEWYGQPQHPLPREVVSFSGETRVEVYPPIFRVYVIVSDTLIPTVTTSRVDISSVNHLSVLAARAATSLRIPTNTPYRVWNVPSNVTISNGIRASDIERGTLVPIPADSKTPISEFVKVSDILTVETHSVSGEWPLDYDSVVAPSATTDPETPPPIFNRGNDYLSNLERSQNKNRITTAVTASDSGSTSRFKNPLSSFTFRGKSPAPAVQRGTMGLQNLGNTCFMNSALQCLSHIPELEEYFLSGLYRHELNFDNPLGMQGQIANVFGALLHNLYPSPGQQSTSRSMGWGSSSSSYAPREFKQTLGRFAPAFSGYQQHDSQEFLGFLLDGLHEDLNRVLKKPYVEKPEWPEQGGGRDMEIKIAQETWDGYKRRNDSIIVDLFQGMYKSTLVCPECAKVSITFDPFMYLTLPLPITKTWRHTVHYIPWDTKKPSLAVEIEVPKDSSYGYLKKLFGRWFDVEPENLLAAEVWSHKFYKFYDDYMNLTELADKDILVVYELPVPVKSVAKPPPPTSFMFNRPGFNSGTSGRSTPNPNAASAPFLIPIFHTAVGQRNGSFGVPSFVVLTPAEASSQDAIYRAVVDRCERWTKNRGNLWRYRGQKMPSRSGDDDELEEVVSNIAPEPTLTDGVVTEIRPDESEAGEEMKVEVVPDVDMAPPETPRDDDSGVVVDADEGDPFEIIAPQEDLFDLKLYNSATTTGIETGFNMNSTSARFVDWATREQANGAGSDLESEDGGSGVLVPPVGQAPAPTPLLKATDALVLAWSPTMHNHFFSPEESLFDDWEPFVHPEVEAARAAQIKSRSGKRSIDLEDCLNEFTKEERLGEDDLWYCPRCKKHQQATKQFQLWSVPDILVVHLKRFSNARAMRDKIDALVEFPIEGLDLGERVGEADPAGCVYDLFAVDEHMGGLGGGHYRAYARNQVDGQWYHFDDSYVSKSNAEESVNANAYLLFYRRRSSSPTAVIEKVKARIGPINDTPTSSKTITDIATDPVIRGSTPEAALPSWDESAFDPIVDLSEYNTLPSGYEDTPDTTYNNHGPYRSTTGGSDDDPPFTNTNTPSPASSQGSVGVAFDSAEEKELDDSDFQDLTAAGGGVKVEVTTTVSESVEDSGGKVA